MTDSNRSESESDVSAEVAPTFAIDSVRRLSGPRRRSTKGGWTSEEDELLRIAVQRYNGKNWKKIAECVAPGLKDKRNDVQCQHRWLTVLDPSLYKGPWGKEEDDLLSKLVKDNMENDKPQWSNIAKHLPGRIGKQCRERWHNHLKPTIKKDPWTSEEEVILVQAQREHGNKWAEIAKLLPGRTENNIKNHWNCSVKKRLEEFPSNLLSGSRPCGFDLYNIVNQSNTMVESYLTNQIKEAAKSPQRDSLELTLGPMNWDTPSSASSLRGDESISSLVESDCSRVNVSESLETPQSSYDNNCIQIVKEFVEKRLRKAAGTFNIPSIISKRSSQALRLKRQRQKDDTSFQKHARIHMTSEEEHSISTSPFSKYRAAKLNTSPGSKPLERRLDFDFM